MGESITVVNCAYPYRIGCMRTDEEIIVDSNLPVATMLAQNPACIASQDIIDSLATFTVQYCGFDKRIHKGQMVMHKELQNEVKNFFVLALELQFPIFTVIPIGDERFAWDDPKSCDANNTSGYNYRTIMGTDRISKHGIGRAFDVNPVQNIYVRYNAEGEEIFRAPENGVYDEGVIGTLTASHPLVKYMKKLKWTWGGDWTPVHGAIDYQHFEK